MADEVDYAAMGDLTLAEALQMGLDLLAGDRNGLPFHPAFLDVGSLGLMGSGVIKRSLVGLGLDEMADVAENGGSSNTQMQTGSFSLTLGRKQLQRDVSGFLRAVLSLPQMRDLGTWLQDFAIARQRTLDRAICVAGSGFSTSLGTTGTPLTVSTFESARNSLDQAGVAGPYIATLYPRQVSDLKASLAAVGGMRQFVEPDRQALDTYGSAYKGSILGVDVFGVTYVPSANSGADSAGFMAGAGAIAHGHAESQPLQGENTQRFVSEGGKLEVEIQRNASTDQTVMVGRTYMAVNRTQAALGRKILSRR